RHHRPPGDDADCDGDEAEQVPRPRLAMPRAPSRLTVLAWVPRPHRYTRRLGVATPRLPARPPPSPLPREVIRCFHPPGACHSSRPQYAHVSFAVVSIIRLRPAVQCCPSCLALSTLRTTG